MSQESLKILLVITKANVGGAQNFVINLAQELRDNNHQVIVASGPGKHIPDKLTQLGIKHIALKYLQRGHNPFSAVLYIFELVKILRDNDCEILHLHSSNALVGVLATILNKNKCKCIFTHHGLSLLDPGYGLKPWKRNLYKLYFLFFSSLLDKQVYICQNNKKTAATLNLLHNHCVIPVGTEIKHHNQLPSTEARKQLEEICQTELAGKFLIGSIARLDYAKNFELVIPVINKLKIDREVLLLIIGEGPERKKYEEIINQATPKKCILAGELANASKYLSAFDLFLLPSRYEGMSLTIIEAMMSALPCLVSNVGANEELLPTTEQIFASNCAEDFERRLQKLIRDKNLRDKLAAINLINSQKYSVKNMSKQYIDLYYEVLEKNRNLNRI